MADTEVFEKKDNTPLESYSFTYSDEEYSEANKGSLRGFTVRTVVLGVAFAAVTAGVVLSDATNFLGGMLVGWTLLYFVLSLAGLFNARKGWKSTKERICSSVFEYELFDTYMLLTVTWDGERIHFVKLAYENLISKIDTGGLYILNFANQLYVIKKQEIAENSIFHTLKPKAPEKPSATLSGLSKALMVLSIVSGVAGVFFAMSKSMSYGALEWWFLPAFGLIPLISFVFGLYMKKYGGGKGTVIAGLLAFAFLCGMFYASVNSEDSDIKKGQQILSIESYMGVGLPEPFAYDNFRDSINGIEYEDTAMQFYSRDVEYLEGVIESSADWSRDFNDETSELVAEVGTADDWDYVCVYNITTGEYNKLPAESGVYSMAAMYYDMEYNGLYVIEYEFTK